MIKILKKISLLFSNRQILNNCLKEKGLSLLLFACYVAVVIIPLLYSANFSLSKFSWLVIGKAQNGDLALNTPVLIFLPICLLVAADQIFDLKARIFDRSSNLVFMLDKLSVELPKIRRYCEMGARIAELTHQTNARFARKKLKECISKSLKVFNGFIAAYADTISEETVITSNIMISLTQEDYSNPQEYSRNTQGLEQHDIYRSNTSDALSQTGWLILLASCAESRKRYKLATFAMKLMSMHCDSLVGAPDAWHIGKNISEDRDYEYGMSYVHDVNRIEFNTNNKQLQEEATKHFKRLKYIRSFVSAPILYGDMVVGVYNVNSSDKVLAGINDSQKAVLQLLISLFTQTVAHCVLLWRRYEYNTKA